MASSDGDDVDLSAGVRPHGLCWGSTAETPAKGRGVRSQTPQRAAAMRLLLGLPPWLLLELEIKDRVLLSTADRTPMTSQNLPCDASERAGRAKDPSEGPPSPAGSWTRYGHLPNE